LLLKGNGKGDFSPVLQTQTGFYVPGNAKGLAQLTNKAGRRIVIATQNRGTLRSFGQNGASLKWIALQPHDAYALIRDKKGTTRRQELYYGASFLSQSVRKLVLTTHDTSVEIVDFQGKKRKVM
jgi:hypothetical protein